jgi:N-acetylneuraminate synthase
MAHAFIDAAADAGADAIKFQTHIAAEESTLDEPFRVRFSDQDSTRYAYWKRMEFTTEQWGKLAEHARRKGLVFLSSPFSVSAARLLGSIGMDAWKVGSGEVRSEELLDEMGRHPAPILLSSGMSTMDEVDQSVARIKEKGLPLAVFQCTSSYPTPFEKVGLNVIDEFKRRYRCPAGLSDHSGSIYPGLAAMATGADLLEVHVTFDRRMFGPGEAASVTLEELGFLVEAKTAFHTMFQYPVDKDEMAKDLEKTRNVFMKSLAPVSDLSAGTLIREEMLTLKKPGTGIPKSEIDRIKGRRLKRDVSSNRLITWDDLE